MRYWVRFVVWAVASLAGAAGAQTPVAPPSSLAGELGSLASRAALVFTGQVVSIERRGSVVEVNFQVEQPVVGTPGATYTLREWAGLWPAGQYRYTVGQRALVFLQQPSAAGLGSPVDGAEGVVPVVVQGANAPELLDIRRLAAAIVRSPGTPLPTEAEGAIQLTEALRLVAVALQPHPLGAPRPQDPVRLPLPVRGGRVPGPSAGEPEPILPSAPRGPVVAGVGDLSGAAPTSVLTGVLTDGSDRTEGSHAAH